MNITAVRWLAAFLVALGLSGARAQAPEKPREQTVQLAPDAPRKLLQGRIQGRAFVDYLVQGKAGQTLSATLSTRNLSAYFNVLPPGSEQAIFIGSSDGARFRGVLPSDGEYRLRVYLMRSAARRNEVANYMLDVRLSQGGPGTLAAFEKSFELHGIGFQVSSANQGSVNQLRVLPSGLELDNTPIVREIEGVVVGAEVADLNADGSPEIYIYIMSAGSGSYGSVVAYSANRRKSLSEIHLPVLTDNARLSRGYRGHDEFAVGEGRLLHRFPIYRDADTNASPSGGMRQLQYRLRRGEASWQLRVDRVVEF